MLVDMAHAAVDNTCVDSLDRGFPDSPTLSTSTTSTELDQLSGHTSSKMFHYQTPHFSDYPCKYPDV